MHRFLLLGALAAFQMATTAAAYPATSRMDGLVGNWSCTTQFQKQMHKYTITYSKANSYWLMGTADMPAMMGAPAHKEKTMYGYDSQRHQWIYMMSASDGEYFIGKSAAPENASTQVWTTVYPQTQYSGTLTINYMGSNRMTLDGKWTQNGKPMSSRDNCVKQ